MKIARMVFNQINRLTSDLVGTALCNDQNFPIKKGISWDTCQIETDNNSVAAALKNRPYQELYYSIEQSRNYNLKLLDGALLQLQYRFENNELVNHRLAFYPNPDLSLFQNSPDAYLEDEIYLDIIDRRVVVTPLRFDFDSRKDIVKSIEHPVSHLTLGQYKNCRIPVARPITPCQFVFFIIRNFYHTAYNKYCEKLTEYNYCFDKTITDGEQHIIHIGIC